MTHPLILRAVATLILVMAFALLFQKSGGPRAGGNEDSVEMLFASFGKTSQSLVSQMPTKSSNQLETRRSHLGAEYVRRLQDGLGPRHPIMLGLRREIDGFETLPGRFDNEPLDEASRIKKRLLIRELARLSEQGLGPAHPRILEVAKAIELLGE